MKAIILTDKGEPIDIVPVKDLDRQEYDNLKKEIDRARGKLSNEGFISKAPAQLVQQEKDKLEANLAKATALENRIAELKENL